MSHLEQPRFRAVWSQRQLRFQVSRNRYYGYRVFGSASRLFQLGSIRDCRRGETPRIASLDGSGGEIEAPQRDDIAHYRVRSRPFWFFTGAGAI